MAPRSRKTAKTTKKSKAKKVDTAGFADSILQNLLCPITSSLLVCPVTAEDGRVYEADALERWLRSHRRSPLTNEPMGEETMKSGMTRSFVLSAIENGVVDDEAASTWYLESAKAIAAKKLPGKLSSAKEHLEKAAALHPSPEVDLMLRAIALKSEMDEQMETLLDEAADAGVDGVAIVFGVADGLPLKQWTEMNEHISRVRIIDDLDEVERLCERPAPGAEEHVGWCDEMDDFVGQECLVVDQDEEGMGGYGVLPFYDTDGPEVQWFPFDACVLVRR
ncbi:hypothetical protein JL720_4262 [Aureococcus anophagefferens]|nr:hypothetical protein JL720_4262 [Aureococcus anophagefferens]